MYYVLEVIQIPYNTSNDDVLGNLAMRVFDEEMLDCNLPFYCILI